MLSCCDSVNTSLISPPLLSITDIPPTLDFFCHSFRFYGIPYYIFHFPSIQVTVVISYIILHAQNIHHECLHYWYEEDRESGSII